MTWGFIWLMLVMKIPILMLFGLVWWAVRQYEEPPAGPEPEKVPRRPRPHPPVLPRHRRPRGPHGDAAVPPSPPRVRPVTAIAAGTAARRHADR